MMKKDMIIRESEIKKILNDTSISINQREKVFHYFWGADFDNDPKRNDFIKVIEKIIKIHRENILEHIELEFR